MGMNKKQFMILMAGMKSNYPNWKMDLQDRVILEFWYDNLKDIPYEIAQVGVKKLLAEEEFYPNIAKIRKACASIQGLAATDSTEAWGLVKRAISKFGYMRCKEAVESLPFDVVKAISYMGGWKSLCESSNPEADRAHFYRCMDQIKERETRDRVLSLDLKEQIASYQKLALSEASNKGSLEKVGDILSRTMGLSLEMDTRKISHNMIG